MVDFARFDVPSHILNYALNTYDKLRPLGGRKSGIPERPGEVRGQGDLYDLIASCVLFEHLADLGMQVANLMVARRGDDGADMQVWEKATSRRLIVNVKTSNTTLSSERHLLVKHEELRKENTALYIQCIMRVGWLDQDDPTYRTLIPTRTRPETEDPPHFFILGWCRRGDEAWQKGELREIANTPDDHPGLHIKGYHLRSFQELLPDLAGSI